ncbi:hypothetical protein [Nitrosospira sp. Nsp13]|uniref:hypothetical protein n=1 Tax=Nitrosospira sp. Nsp13 TaxID=1855332 RepID=UPI00088820B5|nr:hypothetical protein [Nitrosospira sp. Nsp13]SCY31528.1 hypothetical protein SAMN05216308_107127 [Nitrosospira sp. Nsp13]
MKRIALVCTLLLLASIQGCATKIYGRQGSVTSFERTTMTCREMDLEIAKTRGFVDHVNKEAAFSGRDILAFLADFGIGNNLERTAALESADTRIKQLEEQRQIKQCAVASAQP